MYRWWGGYTQVNAETKNPEEDVRCHRAGVTASYEPPDTGAKYLFKSSACS